MSAKEFYLKTKGHESINSVEEFDTPVEVIVLMDKYADFLKINEMRDVLTDLVNNKTEILNALPANYDYKWLFDNAEKSIKEQ